MKSEINVETVETGLTDGGTGTYVYACVSCTVEPDAISMHR